jgi:hypothetical protein
MRRVMIGRASGSEYFGLHEDVERLATPKKGVNASYLRGLWNSLSPHRKHHAEAEVGIGYERVTEKPRS